LTDPVATSNLDLIQWRALVYLAEKWDLIILLDDVEVLLKSATDRGIQESGEEPRPVYTLRLSG